LLRTAQEWWDFCMERGTSGSQVFDILTDWKEREKEIEETLKYVKVILSENNKKDVIKNINKLEKYIHQKF